MGRTNSIPVTTYEPSHGTLCFGPYSARHGTISGHGVATISRLLKIEGLFCRMSSLLYVYFTKETYNCKEPTNRSHPIRLSVCIINVYKPGHCTLKALDCIRMSRGILCG